MKQFRMRKGIKSVVLRLKRPFADIGAIDTIVQQLKLKNPLGCTSYRSARKHHPPVEIVREMYTAKFRYLDENKKQVGSSSEVYNSVEGYHTGIAAMISNMANIAAHHGKVKHLPEADHFSVLLKCHDPDGELFFMSLARDRITLASYTDDAIRRKVEAWAGTVPALA